MNPFTHTVYFIKLPSTVYMFLQTALDKNICQMTQHKCSAITHKGKSKEWYLLHMTLSSVLIK